MKYQPDSLGRLFRAARRAHLEAVAEPPFGFEGRVLAQYRSAKIEDDSVWMVLLLKRAFFAACVVALLSVVLSYRFWREPVQNELTLADSVIKMTLLP